MTLPRYILRRFFASVLYVLLAIAVIVLIFSGVENLRRFGGGAAGVLDIFFITALQAPDILYQVFPLIVMLASLATFLGFARTSELVVLRAAGVSALRLIAIPAFAGIVLGMAVVAVVNPLVAASIRHSAVVEEEFRGSGARSFMSVGGGAVWLRQGEPGGQTVIRAERATPDGAALSGVMLHRFDRDGQLYARIEAEAAHLVPGAWLLADAARWELAGDSFVRVEGRSRLRLATELTSDQILESFSPPDMISLWELNRFITQLEEAGFSGLRHRLHLEAELSKPILLAAMVLIGAAFSLRPGRFGHVGVMVLLAVLAGFTLYFIRDFAQSLGASGEVPLRLAVWTPPVAAILFALGLLLHLEDG